MTEPITIEGHPCHLREVAIADILMDYESQKLARETHTYKDLTASMSTHGFDRTKSKALFLVSVVGKKYRLHTKGHHRLAALKAAGIDKITIPVCDEFDPELSDMHIRQDKDKLFTPIAEPPITGRHPDKGGHNDPPTTPKKKRKKRK